MYNNLLIKVLTLAATVGNFLDCLLVRVVHLWFGIDLITECTSYDPPISALTTAYHPMASLFDLCVEVILQSPSLSEKAALHLPQKISQYVLYEACHGKKFAAVEKLVEAWPHPTLSFDFLSFPLCRQRRESSKSCLLAPEYFGVDSNNELTPCITSITVGVFKNVQRQVYHSDPGSQLQVVDMSQICAAVDNGE